MRKTDEFGIPETAEFIDELDDICCSLEERSLDSKLSRREQALIDVYDTIGGVEGGGLHQFWTGFEDPESVLESLRLIGANEVSDAVGETNWAKTVIERGTDEEGQYSFSKEEEERLDKSEEKVYNLFIGLPTRLLAFAKQHQIQG